ncbi:MAG: hypothetical protein ACM3S2_06720 [Ignavibacteriales bacterium]
MGKFTIILFLLALASCSSDRNAAHNSTLLSHSIIIGQGGGFTGRGQGYFIDSTGTVSSYEGLGIPDTGMKVKGRLSDDQITEINRIIPEVLQTQSGGKGNMTSYLVLKKGEKETGFTWSGITPGNSVPSQLRDLYGKLNNMIHSLNK